MSCSLTFNASTTPIQISNAMASSTPTQETRANQHNYMHLHKTLKKYKSLTIQKRTNSQTNKIK